MIEHKMEAKEPEMQTVPTIVVEPGQTLYEKQIDRFVQTAESGVIGALNRYGFTLFHSLPAEERMLRQEELGIACKDPSDLYNLGLAHASKQHFDRAIACWEKALKAEPEMGAALFNIAVAHEQMGDLKRAREEYKRYSKEFADSEESQRIADHLAEIEN